MSDSRIVDRETLLERRAAIKLAGGLVVGAGLARTGAARDKPVSRALPFEEYSRHDALGLAELVRNKAVKPEELLEAAIARAEAVNGEINAIVIKCYDRARDAIKGGLPDGPFKGVPFLVKDLGFSMAGVKSTAGSRLFKDVVAGHDDTIVKRYRQAGLVLLGRTHSPELGIPPVTESVLYGITRNPWSRDRTAGGSSGGTAAAVAAGVVPMGSASDGGGSIRIPASCCGLFGLKPTRARVPCGPEIFELFEGLAVMHAVTRSVRDSAALLDATAGPELGDAYWAPSPRRAFLNEVGVPPKKLRVGVTLEVLPGASVDEACQRAVQDAADLCESLGHHVEVVTEEFQAHFSMQELFDAVITMAKTAIASTVEAAPEMVGHEVRRGDVEPVTWRFIEEGRSYTGVDVSLARTIVHRSSRQMAEFQRRYDVILTPTLAKRPVRHGELSLDHHADFLDRFVAFTPFTGLANWTGQPAMSVPVHWSDDELPVGAQFLGRFGDEATLFRLAAQLEQAQPWAERRPPVRFPDGRLE